MHYVNPICKSIFRVKQPENRSGFIRLDQNENPDGVPSWLFEKAINRITPQFLSIYPEESNFLKKYAQLLGVNATNVTLTDGSVVGMGYIFKVFGEKGKKLVCASPTFGMYKAYADMQEMDTIFVQYKKDFTFDIDDILKAIDRSTGIVSLVNPNMPIGNVYCRMDIIRVLEKAKLFNALVVVDEAYYYFNEETVVDLISKYSNLVVLRTFSKLFSIPGLRLGCIISSDSNIRYINNYRPHYTVNSVALVFGEVILEHHDRLVSELRNKYLNGKDYLEKILLESGYKFLPTSGCFICIYPKYKSAEQITEELKQRGLLIFCGKGDSKGLLRVTIWDKSYMKQFVSLLLQIDRAE